MAADAVTACLVSAVVVAGVAWLETLRAAVPEPVAAHAQAAADDLVAGAVVVARASVAVRRAPGRPHQAAVVVARGPAEIPDAGVSSLSPYTDHFRAVRTKMNAR
jgi:hypothetical protein